MLRVFAPLMLGAALLVQPAAAFEPCEGGERVFDVVGDTQVRQRIVDTAVEEWRRFGFQVLDLSTSESEADLSPLLGFSVPLGEVPPDLAGQPNGRLMRMGFAENEFATMPIVRGYWSAVMADDTAAAIPVAYTPWSAAFVSWVMCRAGLSEAQFQRREAHVQYVAAAFIEEAAYGETAQNRYAYVARPVQQTPVRSGDLSCYSHVSTSFEERRALSLSGGDIHAPTHCDIIVGFANNGARVLAIGGNIEQSVTMSVFAGRREGDNVYLQTPYEWRAARPYYAVMQLRARPDLANAVAIRYARPAG